MTDPHRVLYRHRAVCETCGAVFTECARTAPAAVDRARAAVRAHESLHGGPVVCVVATPSVLWEAT